MALFLSNSCMSVCSYVAISHITVWAWESSGTRQQQGFYEDIVQNGSQHAAWHHEPLLSGVYLCTLQVIFHVTIQNKSLEFPSTVPQELSNIGAKCMSKDPAERPTMKDVVATLEKLEPKE